MNVECKQQPVRQEGKAGVLHEYCNGCTHLQTIKTENSNIGFGLFESIFVLFPGVVWEVSLSYGFHNKGHICPQMDHMSLPVSRWCRYLPVSSAFQPAFGSMLGVQMYPASRERVLFRHITITNW